MTNAEHNDGSTEDDNFASIADVSVSRDSSGELQAVTVQNALTVYDPESDTTSKKDIRALQMAYGDAQTKFGDAGQLEELAAEQVADLLDDHLVQPDLTEHPNCPDGYVSEELVSGELMPLMVRDLMLGIFKASGMNVESVEVADDGSAEVDFGEGN